MFLVAKLENHSARWIGISLTLLIGHKRPMPSKLNERCPKATAKGAIVPETILAKSEVTVFPILAPNVYGNICLRFNIPAPASGMTKEVVIELL